MTKEERLSILKKIAVKDNKSVEDVYKAVLLDELFYAGRKAKGNLQSLIEEQEKVLDLYSFENIPVPYSTISYLQLSRNFPITAAVEHVDLNDTVSYIGVYYDGTPTSKYRKEGRYKITPINPD